MLSLSILTHPTVDSDWVREETFWSSRSCSERKPFTFDSNDRSSRLWCFWTKRNNLFTIARWINQQSWRVTDWIPSFDGACVCLSLCARSFFKEKTIAPSCKMSHRKFAFSFECQLKSDNHLQSVAMIDADYFLSSFSVRGQRSLIFCSNLFFKSCSNSVRDKDAWSIGSNDVLQSSLLHLTKLIMSLDVLSGRPSPRPQRVTYVEWRISKDDK